MELSLVGVAFCSIVWLVFLGSFAWDEMWASGVRDGCELV